jgi:tRNA(Ile)-lysidine synthase
MLSVSESQIKSAGLQPGDTLLVAVSGGIDSVVLLHLLSACADRFDLHLQVAHLDHQLRPESADDAEFVRQLCAQLNIPFVLEAKDVAAYAEAEKLSLEMAGRQLRRDFFAQVAEDVGARLVALAHHRDDQVETFLLRLLRGSGVAGLSAMQTLDGFWWRPLLDCSREDILLYAKQQQLEWVEDASNADPQFLRNRVRHQVLGQLREINPQIDERVQELCRQLQVDELYWRQQSEERLQQVLLDSADGIRLDRQQLVVLPEALLVRVLRQAFKLLRGDLQRLEAVHLHAAIDLLNGSRSQSQLDLPGCWVGRRYEVLWLRLAAPERIHYELELPIPGEIDLPDGRLLRASRIAEAGDETAGCVEFDLRQISEPLWVRNWQAGDKFCPAGMDGSKKLKRFFSDEKVELEERHRVPLLVSGEKLLWIVGMRRSALAAVTEKSTEILRVEVVNVS